MTLYKAMSAVKRRELEAEIERLRNLGFDSVDREEKLREQLERQSKALTEAYAAIEAYKGKPVMLHRDIEELARLRVEVGQLHVLRAENAELRKQLVFDGKALADAALCLDELDWFRRRDELVDRIKAATNLHAEALAVLALIEWEEKSPKPGAGT